jgi:hypothetical protein
LNTLQKLLACMLLPSSLAAQFGSIINLKPCRRHGNGQSVSDSDAKEATLSIKP